MTNNALSGRQSAKPKTKWLCWTTYFAQEHSVQPKAQLLRESLEWQLQSSTLGSTYNGS